MKRFGSLTGPGVIALCLLTPPSQYGQSSRPAIVNPHNVAYCTMGNLIMEYENADVPADLARRFDGYEVAVGVAFDGSGQFGCGYQPMVNKPKHAALRLPTQTLRRIATPLCYSMRKWKFRPFIYDGKVAPVMGPVVVTIRHGKFVLDVLDAPCQSNPRPIEKQ